MDKGHTKRKILGVAGTLFSRHGRNGVGIRAIAKEVGVSVNTVMYHFQNKENLYRKVVLDQISREIPFDRIFLPIHESDPHSFEDVANQLALIIRNLFDVFREKDRSEHADFLVQALFTKDEVIAKSLMSAFNAFDAPLMEYFNKNKVQYDKPTFMFISYILWSQVLFYASAKESVTADMGVPEIAKEHFYDTARRITEVFCQQLKLPAHDTAVWTT